MIKMLVGQELDDQTAADVNLDVVDGHKVDVDVIKMVLILIKPKCKDPQVS